MNGIDTTGLLLAACLLDGNDGGKGRAALAERLSRAAEHHSDELAAANLLLCAAVLYLRVGERSRARCCLLSVREHAPSVHEVMQGFRTVEKLLERAESDAKEAP